MLKIGDRLGRFELKTELGRGSHGVVFEAIDVLLNERVAIKCLQPWLSGDVTLRERFKRELVLTRRVSHPGVCRLHDLHEEDEVLFISMQHIEGKSLSQVLRAALPTPDRVIQLLRGVCSALSAAHDEGVVHRDLKPANIMITNTDKVVVLDFGIATATGVGQLTRPGEAMGSVPYVPPEIWNGGSASAHGDQYALGVTAFVCLTRELPYTGKTALDVLDAIRGPRPTVRSRIADVDLELEAAILKAMAVSAVDRFDSIAGFDAALRRIADRRAAGLPASQTPEEALAFLSAPSASVAMPTSPSGSLPVSLEPSPAPTDPKVIPTPSLLPQVASEPSPPAAPLPTVLTAAMPAAEPLPPASTDAPVELLPATAPTGSFAAADNQEQGDPLTVPSSAFILTNDPIPATPESVPPTRVLSTAGFEERTAIVERHAVAGHQRVQADVVDEPVDAVRASRKGVYAAVAGLGLVVVLLAALATRGEHAPVDIAIAPAATGSPTASLPDVPPVDVKPLPPVTFPVAPPVEALGALVRPDEPGGAQPVEPAAAPVAPKRASTAALDVVAAAAAKRGVRAGDAPAVDAALARGKSAARANDEGAVDTAAKAARSALDAVVVDKAFVSDKLGRFNKAFDAVTDSAVKDQLRPLSREVLGYVSKGDWAEANRRLNDGLFMITRPRTKKP